MKVIKPVNLSEEEIIKIFKTIQEYLKDTLYQPIQDLYKNAFNKRMVLNEISNELKQAFISNKLIYKDGYITGNFNANLTRQLKNLGAVYNARKKAFQIDILPAELLNIVYNNQFKTKSFIYDLDEFLNAYLENLAYSIDFLNLDYTGTINNYNKQISNNFEKFAIKPNINEYQIKSINDNYTNSSKLYIKNWLEKDIKSLRETLKKFVLEDGYSNKSIADYIQKNYKTTQQKSIFLARQESSLLLAEYTKTQYLDLGITKYKWLTARDERVRDYPKNNGSGGNHKDLDGLIFSFSDPPITNLLTGDRHNPGEAFNCRCVASPILE